MRSRRNAIENEVQDSVENVVEQLAQVDRQHSVRSRKITIRVGNWRSQFTFAIRVRNSRSPMMNKKPPIRCHQLANARKERKKWPNDDCCAASIGRSSGLEVDGAGAQEKGRKERKVEH